MSLVFSTSQAAAAEPSDADTGSATSLLGEQQLIDGVVDSVDEVTRTKRADGAGSGTEHGPDSAADQDRADAAESQPAPADESSATNKPAERVLHSATASLPVQVSLDRVGEGATATFGSAASDGRALVRGLATKVRSLPYGADLSSATALPSLAGPVDGVLAPGHTDAPAASTGHAEAPLAAAQRPATTGAERQTASSPAMTADTAGGAGPQLPADSVEPTGGTEDEAPVGPLRHTAPSGQDSTYLGSGSGSAGSHAVAEQLALLAVWRPAVPAQYRDARPLSDDEGRPSVSPD